MYKMILASTSPRRKQLLKKVIDFFEVISPSYEEEFEGKPFSYPLIERMSLNKALSVLPSIETPSYILSADTVVVFNGEILGKPYKYLNAFEMLKKLSSTSHWVVTSHTLLDSKTSKTLTISNTSIVKFSQLSDEQIDKYIKEYEPYDKAGAYGIQEMPKGFISSYQGSLTNIIGLSIETVSELFQEFGIFLNKT